MSILAQWLESRLIHQCLDIILQPVKTAAEIGIMMSDPLGNLHHVYPALAAYIVDTPESAMLACVVGKTSSVTMANYRQFALEASSIDPWDLATYSQLALSRHHLNGVHQPFWRNWPMAEPSQFLTPEPLHHWHKMFWDHDAKWCIHAVGKAKIDFRFSILHPQTGYLLHHVYPWLSMCNQLLI
ncbi:hypothetical protein BDZ94DRAFT_1316610 [Collybia nuda]|uniref:Uncharacterized protein n=1 Tax=Collybia nuda TaxID=64659 RepID=A0A9P5XP82_9AGAR|nr:hypothetical protein BDZ94DRAFT_1316610 [Collybia nuda]